MNSVNYVSFTVNGIFYTFFYAFNSLPKIGKVRLYSFPIASLIALVSSHLGERR